MKRSGSANEIGWAILSHVAASKATAKCKPIATTNIGSTKIRRHSRGRVDSRQASIQGSQNSKLRPAFIGARCVPRPRSATEAR